LRDIWERVNLAGLSEMNFKRFAAALYRLIELDCQAFDMILVGGNTGLVMAKFAQLVYEHLGKVAPYVIKTTPQRYIPGKEETEDNLFDNSILELDIRNQLIDYRIPSGANVLFVDDEISAGTTAKVCLTALANALLDPLKQINFHIIAEDQGYRGLDLENSGLGEKVSVVFLPFAPGIDGLSNVITYVVPHEIKLHLSNIFPDHLLSPHKLCNILLDLPVRDKDTALCGFSYRLNRIARESIPELAQLQIGFLQYVRRLVEEAVKEYKAGQLDLEDREYIQRYISD
jgi:hypothetical protein